MKIAEIRDRGHVFDVAIDIDETNDPDKFEWWTFNKSKLENDQWKKDIKKRYELRNQQKDYTTEFEKIKKLKGKKLE